MTPTALAYLWPWRVLDTDAVAELDLAAYSDRFEWERDGWNGAKDTVTPVRETVATARGDCDDYAFVAASWALANGREDVGLAVCLEPWRGLPLPTHMVAYDSERVYSSGWIFEGSLVEYLAETTYTHVWPRRV